MSQRSIKMAQFLKKELAELISYKVKDPRMGFVTVTRVELTEDLSFARIYYSLLGDAREKKSSQVALNRAKGFLKRELAKHLNVRHMPDIDFVFDKSIEYSLHLEKVFEKIKGEGGEA